MNNGFKNIKIRRLSIPSSDKDRGGKAPWIPNYGTRRMLHSVEKEGSPSRNRTASRPVSQAAGSSLSWFTAARKRLISAVPRGVQAGDNVRMMYYPAPHHSTAWFTQEQQRSWPSDRTVCLHQLILAMGPSVCLL